MAVYDRGTRRVWHPDFTLPDVRAPPHDTPLIIEYAGMPDRDDYMVGLSIKRRVYRQNEINALMVYPRDLSGPRWPADVITRVRSHYRSPQSASAATTTRGRRASFYRMPSAHQAYR